MGSREHVDALRPNLDALRGSPRIRTLNVLAYPCRSMPIRAYPCRWGTTLRPLERRRKMAACESENIQPTVSDLTLMNSSITRGTASTLSPCSAAAAIKDNLQPYGEANRMQREPRALRVLHASHSTPLQATPAASPRCLPTKGLILTQPHAH